MLNFLWCEEEHIAPPLRHCVQIPTWIFTHSRDPPSADNFVPRCPYMNKKGERLNEALDDTNTLYMYGGRSERPKDKRAITILDWSVRMCAAKRIFQQRNDVVFIRLYLRALGAIGGRKLEIFPASRF